MEPLPSPARRLWHAIEPLHAVVYFAAEPTAAAIAAGVRGRLMGYVVGRWGPLGPVPTAVVAAMAYGFAPAAVARALPEGWQLADPSTVVEARMAAAAGVLRANVPAPDLDALVGLRPQLWDAVGACGYDARPLAAAWSTVPRPDDPVADVWLATTVLREHRGDGHVLAGVAAGLDGLDAVITMVATGAVPREQIQPRRGWTDDEWAAAEGRLRDRGLLDGGGALTAAGRELRAAVEDATDRLAAAPVEHLGPAATEQLLDVAVPASRALFDAGVVTAPNPIGAPRP